MFQAKKSLMNAPPVYECDSCVDWEYYVEASLKYRSNFYDRDIVFIYCQYLTHLGRYHQA